MALLRLPDVPPHVRHPFNGKEGLGDLSCRRDPLLFLKFQLFSNLRMNFDSSHSWIQGDRLAQSAHKQDDQSSGQL